MFRLDPAAYLQYDLTNFDARLLIRTCRQTGNTIVIIRVHDNCPIRVIPAYRIHSTYSLHPEPHLIRRIVDILDEEDLEKILYAHL